MSFQTVKKEMGKHYAFLKKRKGKYNIKEGILSLLLAGFLAAVPFTVSAQTASADAKKIAMGIVKNYNLIVFGDFACAGSDTEGAIAVGGNIDLSGGFGVNNKSIGDVGLVIGGTTLSANNGQVNGKVIARDGLTCKFSGNFTMKDIKYCKDDAEFNNILDFAALKSGLQAESQDLAKLQPNGIVEQQLRDDGKTILLFKGTQQGANAVNVFAVDDDIISGTTGDFYFDIPKNTTAIINVRNITGNVILAASSYNSATISVDTAGKLKLDEQNGYLDEALQSSSMLWNFNTITEMKKTGTSALIGSILAPNATFNVAQGARGHYAGTLIVNEVKDEVGIQGHNYPFSGTLPQSESSSSSTDSSSKEESSSTPSSSEISSVPDESVPVSSTPASSVPDESVPVSSIPASSVPDESKPVSSTPVSSVPNESKPVSSASTTSIPDESTPLAGPGTGDFSNIIIFVAFGSLAVITLRVAFKIRKNT